VNGLTRKEQRKQGILMPGDIQRKWIEEEQISPLLMDKSAKKKKRR
jgi:hypothetical protein